MLQKLTIKIFPTVLLFIFYTKIQWRQLCLKINGYFPAWDYY